MSEIQRHARAGHPLVRVETWEEDEAARELVAAVRAELGPATELHEWDAAQSSGPPDDERSLEDILDAAASETSAALYLIRDAHRFLDRPGVVRRIRRLRAAIGARPVRVALLMPPQSLPSDLAHEVPSAVHALPTFQDLARLVEAVEVETGTSRAEGITSGIVASALRGMTRLEARFALLRVARSGAIDAVAITQLFDEKARRLQGSTLEFYPPTVRLEDLGGLGGFKEWVRRRESGFRALVGGSPAPAGSTPPGKGGGWGGATATGVTGRTGAHDDTVVTDSMGRTGGGVGPPRGVLLTGVSGCGKSLAAKSLSRALGAPLFRLDMAHVFAQGEPEATFARALGALEAMAPCILWIDEIENALALGAQDTGSASRISGSFLTWLQERPEGIFVVATANRIEILPAELLRRGRFDQIFFVDLPQEEERKVIWSIHLARVGENPARFDLVVLARATAAWSGAEIEAAVSAASVDATHEGKPLGKDQLFRAIGRTVPLAVTMKEQIKRVKEWAHDRALPATSEE